MKSTKEIKVTKEILFKVVTKALENADQLLDEARILLDNEKNARAYTLYQLSIEEVGKVALAFHFILSGNYEVAKDKKDFVDAFMDHKSKTKKAIGIDFMLIMCSENLNLSRDMLTEMHKQYESVNVSNNMKNYSLYTSIVGDDVLLPSEIIDKSNASEIGYYAQLRYNAAKLVYGSAIQNFESFKAAYDKLDFEKVAFDNHELIKKLRI